MAIGDKIKVLLANKAMSLNDTEKTQARANIDAAPSGFGLGTDSALCSDCNDAIYNGWYKCSNAANTPSILSYGWMIVASGTNGMIRQDFYTEHIDPIHCCRYCINGVWQPWEYINPPMQLGVEYRTTERYLGNYCTRSVDTDGIEYWSSPAMLYWHSTGKAIAHDVPAGGNTMVSLMNDRTYFLACSDNVRSGLVAVQTSTSNVKAITPIIPLKDWNVTIGTGLTVNVAELDGRYGMKVVMTCLC